MNSPPLSACIITLNEEENLPRCLASVAFADEIVVVDSYSTDRTVDIAAHAGCRVILQEFLGYVAQKNIAVGAASHTWVLCLDADEWLLPGAEGAIRHALESTAADVAGYDLKRHTFYLGDWVNHSGWWPQYKLRLFDRSRGEWRGGEVHEGVRVSGRVARLNAEIGHHSYRDIAHHLSKVNGYTTTMSSSRYAQDAPPVGLFTLVGRPFWRFIRMFLLRSGWREGLRGLIIASIGAFYVFLEYAKLWELQHCCQSVKPEALRDTSEPVVDKPSTKGSAMRK